MMIDQQVLQAAVDRMVAVSHPLRVILFGSQGRGDADNASDLDLMVLEERVDDRGAEMTRMRKAVGDIGVGVDILVYSEMEYERRRQVPGTLQYWACKEGRTLYDAAS